MADKKSVDRNVMGDPFRKPLHTYKGSICAKFRQAFLDGTPMRPVGARVEEAKPEILVSKVHSSKIARCRQCGVCPTIGSEVIVFPYMTPNQHKASGHSLQSGILHLVDCSIPGTLLRLSLSSEGVFVTYMGHTGVPLFLKLGEVALNAVQILDTEDGLRAVRLHAIGQAFDLTDPNERDGTSLRDRLDPRLKGRK